MQLANLNRYEIIDNDNKKNTWASKNYSEGRP